MKDIINSKVFLYLAFCGRAFLIFALLYAIAIGSVEIPIILSFILLSFCSLFLKNKIEYFYDFLFMVIIVFNTSSFVWDAYGMVDYYDGIVHFITPCLLVILGGHFLTGYFKKPNENKLILILLLTSFGVFLGCLWEILEWVSENTFLPYSVMYGLTDTMSDLMLDFVGAAFGAVFYTNILLRTKKMFKAVPNNIRYRKAFLFSLTSSSLVMLFIGL